MSAHMALERMEVRMALERVHIVVRMVEHMVLEGHTCGAHCGGHTGLQVGKLIRTGSQISSHGLHLS